MSDALAELLGDATQARSIGRAARRHVEQHYSIDRMVSAYEALYSRLIR